MPRNSEKVHILDNAGFAYNFDRMMYINRQAKKAFSLEFVEDHLESEIVSRIRTVNVGGEWCFYTNQPLSEGVQRELRRVLE